MNLDNMTLENLNKLCSDIREKIIDVVLKNGGHLASNLGVVELTVALKKVFSDSKKNRILFDVGHQGYVYKILTGREENFSTLRTYKGLGPFLDPKESSEDYFISGHAGSALSAGCGIAYAEPEVRVIVVVGDASIANGHSLEALNNMGNLKNMIVVLNDNDMSIGKSVGSLSNFFSRMISSRMYMNVKKDVKNIIDRGKFGRKVKNTLGRAEHSIKNFFLPMSISENLGFKYFGVVDGHNMEELLNIFEKAKETEGPVFIHVRTKKGKGYKPAEENKEKFHGVSPYNPFKVEGQKTYSDIFGEKLVSMAETDKDIYAISAGMVKGTGLKEFFEKYPERSIDVGIAEGHGVTFAAGLAISGKKPYYAVYSTFLSRGVGQLIHDVSLQNLPVRFMIDRAGIVGEDGKTHHGIYDVPFMLSIPNFTIIAPTTKKELEEVLEFSQNYNSPIGIRYSKENGFDIEGDKPFVLGKWREIRKGEKNLYIGTGSMLKEILDVEEILKEKGISGTIVSAASIKPMDTEFINKNFEKYDNIIVLEESYFENSFGSEIIDYINNSKINKKIIKIGIETGAVPHGKRGILLEEYGLRGLKLVERIEGKINGES